MGLNPIIWESRSHFGRLSKRWKSDQTQTAAPPDTSADQSIELDKELERRADADRAIAALKKDPARMQVEKEIERNKRVMWDANRTSQASNPTTSAGQGRSLPSSKTPSTISSTDG